MFTVRGAPAGGGEITLQAARGTHTVDPPAGASMS
jgi:hypothetical protein